MISFLFSVVSLALWLFALGGTGGMVLGVAMGAWVTWPNLALSVLCALAASYLSHVFE